MKAMTFMPEYVVPYVFHLLAHHAHFPTDKEDAKGLRFCKR